jgi:hypothetical protein
VPPRGNKYGAKKTPCAGGHTHDSKAEAARCDDLRALEDMGHIVDLVHQPVFRVEINDKLMCKYIADFAWWKGDVRIVEDVKGMTTPVFNLKKKLVEATHPGVVITLFPPRKRKARKAKAA